MSSAAMTGAGFFAEKLSIGRDSRLGPMIKKRNIPINKIKMPNVVPIIFALEDGCIRNPSFVVFPIVAQKKIQYNIFLGIPHRQKM